MPGGGKQVGRVFLPFILASVFLLVIFLTKITLRLSYRKQGRDDHFALGFSLWRGLIRYKLEVPVIKMQAYDQEPKKERQGLKPLLWPRPAYKIKAEIEGKGGRLLSQEKKKFSIPKPLNSWKFCIMLFQ
jgi:hypothetical protein